MPVFSVFGIFLALCSHCVARGKMLLWGNRGCAFFGFFLYAYSFHYNSKALNQLEQELHCKVRLIKEEFCLVPGWWKSRRMVGAVLTLIQILRNSLGCGQSCSGLWTMEAFPQIFRSCLFFFLSLACSMPLLPQSLPAFSAGPEFSFSYTN